MISRLSGDVLEQSPGRIVVNLSGLGIEVLVPALMDVPSNHESISLFTRLIVREDSLTIFGFESEVDRLIFDLLCSVSGVGPRSALGVLSTLETQVILQAISNDDDATFRRVSGIGPKTAKLICVSLASKVQKFTLTSKQTSPKSEGQDVLQALVGLGWKDAQAAAAIENALVMQPGLAGSSLLRFVLSGVGASKTARASDE